MRTSDTLRAAEDHARRTRSPLRVLSLLVFVVAGFMIATSALAARGNDLRPDRTTELAELVGVEADRVDGLSQQAADLQAEIDQLTATRTSADPQPGASDTERYAIAAQTVPVTGPALTVQLTDAPPSVQPAGVDDDLLVVHQQDIQAVMNALWRGGAEAMTIQGQRVSSRTGIKCVGNTVVVHGVPYAPPYVITAIGPVDGLAAELESDQYLTVYRQYVQAYRLGYEVTRQSQVSLPAHAGPSEFTHASAVR